MGCPGIPDNPSLAEITNNLSKIKTIGSQTNISPCNFILPRCFLIFDIDWRPHRSKLIAVNNNYNFNSDCLLWMLEGCKGHGYYTYKGSLTTPPYQECVIWIISPIVNKISVRQVRGVNIKKKKENDSIAIRYVSRIFCTRIADRRV